MGTEKDARHDLQKKGGYSLIEEGEETRTPH